MGDRANVFMVDRKPDSTGLVTGIYLYTHWDGYQWPEMLRKALSEPLALRRWNDEQYLARIVVDQMFRDLRDCETGGGIGTLRCDNEYPIIVLDLLNRQVSFAAEGEEGEVHKWYGTQSYTDFCAQDEADYPGKDEEE